MSSIISLIERHTDATQQLILSTAVELLEQSGFSGLTVRAVAKLAGISERTIFRYFASRGDFLDGVAAEVTRSVQTPPPPATTEELLVYPRILYTRFDERARLVEAALHSDLVKRLRATVARERGRAVRDIIDKYGQHCSQRDRKIAAGNIRYYLAATTWHYYRFELKFSLKETIDSAQSVVKLVLEDIRRP